MSESPGPLPRVILASASPRRKALLGRFGFPFDVIPSRIDETLDPTLPPQEQVMKLSEKKALTVAEVITERPVLVIGADTIVVHKGRILGQPACEEEARQMLRRLSDSTHTVFTGVSLLNKPPDLNRTVRHTFFEQTRVRFAALEEEEIERYVRSGSPLDKAGAYGIQDDDGALFVSSITGDYFTVVGFPLRSFYTALKLVEPRLLAFRKEESHAKR